MLVFLGGILTSYEAYLPEDRPAVRHKFRTRAWLAFSGFLFALLSATSGLVGLFWGPIFWMPIGLITLALSGILLVLIALMSVREIA